jgi:hypothetical protein
MNIVQNVLKILIGFRIVKIKNNYLVKNVIFWNFSRKNNAKNVYNIKVYIQIPTHKCKYVKNALDN